MRLRGLTILLWLGVTVCTGFAESSTTPYNTITVESSSTSIYIGKVTLNLTPLVRQNGVYSADYKAKVFPFFFMNEHGSFRLTVSDDDLSRIARGETVEFQGQAQNNGQEERKITGRATPEDAKHGKIKVRIFVTEKIQLIFNTTYRTED